MINNETIKFIEKVLNNKKIIYSKLLSDSFGINCISFRTSDKKNYIAKYYKEINVGFNAIKSEAKNLIFLNDFNLKIFPKVYYYDDRFLIISYFNNNLVKPNETKNDLLNAIISLHSLSDKKYGFDFDTQIGGLRQINKRYSNWVLFFRDYRLGYIFELINSSNIMDKSINKKIEIILNNIEIYIPKEPRASLLHGDLWEGNILFNNKNFIGLIDPGSFYGHNELEIAYLRWFNPSFIDKNFIKKYNNNIKIDNEYYNYEPIYQLYYSLLNVYLWDRQYIHNVKNLLNLIKV